MSRTVSLCLVNATSNHPCQAARRMNEARNRAAGNKTLLISVASNSCIKMAAPRWPGLIQYQPDKPDQPGSCNQALTVSCIVTQFAIESFGICRFRGSCMREVDLL